MFSNNDKRYNEFIRLITDDDLRRNCINSKKIIYNVMLLYYEN